MAKSTLKNHELYTLSSAMDQVETSDKELNSHIILAFVKNRKAVGNALQDIEVAKKKIQEKYVEKDKTGALKTGAKNPDGSAPFIFKDKKEGEFKCQQEFNELLTQETKVDLTKIKVANFNLSFNLNERWENPKKKGDMIPRYHAVPILYDHIIVE